ncbi:MAG: hypothetical protein AB1782_14385, partial [Cyanobacteriota bacterium]
TNSVFLYNNVIVSSRNLTSPNTEVHAVATSQGNSGNLTFRAPSLLFYPGSKVYSFSNNNFTPGNIKLITNAIKLTYDGVELNAGTGSVYLSRYSTGDLSISDIDPSTLGHTSMFITTGELNKIKAANYLFGNNSQTNSYTNNIVFYNSYEFLGDLYSNANNDTTLKDNVNLRALNLANISTNNNFNMNINTSIDAQNVVVKAHNIDMSADGASILPASGSLYLGVPTAGDLTLKANNYSFGALATYLALNIGNSANTNQLTNNVYLDSDITSSAVTINANNSIIQNNGSINAAFDISLTAQNGNIGTSSDFVDIAQIDIGDVTASATGNIYINESFGDFRIDQITSTNRGDVFLSVQSGRVVDATEGARTNITAGNLFIKKLEITQDFFFVGINGDATSDNNSGLMNYYINVFRNLGENWREMPLSNFAVFDDTIAAFTKDDILQALTNYSSIMSDDDMLVIIYNGHGGGGDPNPQFGEEGFYDGYDEYPLDEANSNALNAADEFMVFNDIMIYDDELAYALQNARGTVVFLSDQCYGGGMFGGNADLDSVANANDFKYFGITHNIEGKLGWGCEYQADATHYFGFVGMLHQGLIDSMIKINPMIETMDADAQSMYDYHNVNLDQVYVDDGNVYLNEWFNAIDKEVYHEAYAKELGGYYTYHYPYEFQNFTNMTANDLTEMPIVQQVWEPDYTFTNVTGIGSSTNPLNVNLTGRTEILSDTEVFINSTGNLNVGYILSAGSDVNINSTGNIIDSRADENPNVFGRSIILTSTQGTIGSITDDLNIFTNNGTQGGTLTATAHNGIINLEHFRTNLYVNYVQSQQNVTISSDGSIIDAREDEQPNIYGRSITLTSSGIGTSSEDVDIYLNYSSSGGKLNAVSYYNNIYLSQYTGNMPIDYIVSYR